MKKLLVAILASSSLLAFAQEDDELLAADEETPAAEEASTTTAPASSAKKKSDGSAKTFFLLPLCRMLEGTGEVRKNGSKEWIPVEEGKFYPLGSEFRSMGAESSLKIDFGVDIHVTLKGDATIGTVVDTLESTTRTVILKSGLVSVDVPRNLAEDLFFVSAPGFESYNLGGESSFRYEPNGDGAQCAVKCLTGTLSLKGRHFDVQKLRSSQGFIIRTSQDCLFTALYGKAGDLTVKLDTGKKADVDPATGELVVKDTYYGTNPGDFRLSPKTAIRIHRVLPAVGENMSVTTMTFDTNGDRKDRFWFAENHYETTGFERPKVDNSKEVDALAKKAAEAADTVDVEVEDDEAASGTEESSSSDDSASSSEDSSTSSSSSSDDDFDF